MTCEPERLAIRCHPIREDVRALGRSSMNRIEKNEAQRTKDEHRNPCRESRRQDLRIAQMLEGEARRKKGRAKNKAQGSANKDVAVLITQDNRKAHNHKE